MEHQGEDPDPPAHPDVSLWPSMGKGPKPFHGLAGEKDETYEENPCTDEPDLGDEL